MRPGTAWQRSIRIPRAWFWAYTAGVALTVAVVAHVEVSTAAAIALVTGTAVAGFAALHVMSRRRVGNHIVRFRCTWGGAVEVLALYAGVPILTYAAALLVIACARSWGFLAVFPASISFGACAITGVIAADVSGLRFRPALTVLGILGIGVSVAHGVGSALPAAGALGILLVYAYRRPVRTWRTID